jgi:hypothetical protein
VKVSGIEKETVVSRFPWNMKAVVCGDASSSSDEEGDGGIVL